MNGGLLIAFLSTFSVRITSSTRILSMSSLASESVNQKVLVLCGPTSVGKSAVAAQVCARVQGSEIIISDAVQIYRHLDIGSNKPTPAETAAVPHHLLDICEPPDEPFSAGEFVRRAAPIVRELQAANKLPVVVGGNTMWIQ
jgi:tRNA dimethylallyltransferase